MPHIKKTTPLVCLLTDFGQSDCYVALVKGVLLCRCPSARFVDITHNIPPQNIRMGAYQITASYRYFPSGSFFICVVDPGVGSERKILYARCGGAHFIAPDNGLLSWIFLETAPDVLLDISKAPVGLPRRSTFHARDIMAPVAGEILAGSPPEKWGVVQKGWKKIPFPQVHKNGSKWDGEILAIDAFGNLITNFRTQDLVLPARHAKVWFILKAARQTIRGLSESYVSVESGKLLAIGGSSGFVEISARNGHAAKVTRLRVGDKIELHFRV